MPRQENSLEPKNEITLIQAIKNSNQIWELVDSCNRTIELFQQALVQNIADENAVLILHLIKLFQYASSEKLDIIFDISDYINQNKSKQECGEILIRELSRLKIHLENKYIEIYLQVESILTIDSEVANIPESMEVSKSSHVANKSGLVIAQEYITISVDIYPLNLALDKTVIDLLLQYGANPNLRGYDPISINSSIPVEDEYFTPLEAACFKLQFYKALSLLSFSQYKINIEVIEKSFNFLLVKTSTNNDPHCDIIANPIVLELLQKLSEKASIKCLVESLDNELANEKQARELLLTIPDGDIYDKRRQECQERHTFLKNSINIYRKCANQQLAFPIWAILLSGYEQKDNVFHTLPHDIRFLIIVTLCNTNFYEFAIDRMNREKLGVFKSICISLMNNGFQKQDFLSLEFFNPQSDHSISKMIETIKIIRYEPSISLRSRLFLLEAWKLTCDTYDNFSPEQDEFVQLIKKAETHSILIALEKIQTLMAVYDPELEAYHLLYDDVLTKHEYSNILSYDEIILDIDKKIEEDKTNRVTDTEAALNLALRYHLNFDSKNKSLIYDLAQWVVNNKQKNHSTPNPSYRLKLFSLSDDCNFSSIKKDIIQCIDDLNNNKNITNIYKNKDVAETLGICKFRY